ncbi:RHS repeat protein [Stenotrophomonas maltophilia]|nr:RHS repeat protein [Stenotrophomonas maltophilia]MBN5151511.1 RHS repeat protein [Stenotrophomonas maltophilia]
MGAESLRKPERFVHSIWGGIMGSSCWRFVTAVLCVASFSSVAQETVQPETEYANKVGKAQQMGRLNDGTFGEKISLFNGQLSFRTTDVSIPGNVGPPVELARKRSISERYLHQGAKPGDLAGFYDWDIDIPYMEGVFSERGWVVGPDGDTSRYQRCSLQKKPYIGEGASYYPETLIWNGYGINLPGQGSSQVLVASANIPMPSDGQSYPWVTTGNVRIRCLSQTKNGAPGEAFLAITPDGTRYYLNWVVSREMPRFTYKDNPLAPTRTLTRSHVFFLASRVEDRFGNWVDYGYSGDKLTSITSSDGRAISLTYSGDRIATAAANGRIWTYQYREPGALGSRVDGGLSAVVLPDGTRWSYNSVGSLRPPVFGPVQEGSECDPNMGTVYGPYSYTVGHPAGAAATYSLEYRYFYRAVDISPCSSPEQVPYTGVWNLKTRTVMGPGLPPMTTGYAFQDGVPVSGRWTTVTQPDGSVSSYRFGVRPRVDEAKLLEMRTANAAGTTLESITYGYLTKEEAVGQFTALVGQSLSIITPTEGLLEPEKLKVTTREGTQYTERVDRFDSFARPVEKYSGSELAVAKDRAVFYDNLGTWTLGGVARMEDADTGEVQSRTEFNAQALPQSTWEFGKLKQTFAYDALGNISQVADGNGNVTKLLDYKRGMPRRILYADGTAVSATIDDNGWVLSRTDEIGATTGYSYDSMGRLELIHYPAGDVTGWNDTIISNQRTSGSERGLAPGHWKKVESTGNARRVTYHDALMRPVLTEEYDATNRSSSLRQVINAYDYAGRTTFQSYPGRYRLGEP